MTLSEAARLVKLFAQFWPSASMPKETAALWAREIQRYDPMDVAEAAALLGESRQWMPSLAEFIAGVKECRRDRLRLAEQELVLPAKTDAVSFAEFLRDNPEWKERVLAMDTRDPFNPKRRSLMSETFTRLLKEHR